MKKQIKHLILAILLLTALAATTSSCHMGRVCQANKIGNHR